MQVLKYNTARRSDAVWGRKAPRLPMAIGIGLQIAHLSRFIGIVGPRCIILSDTASGLRLASEPFAAQRGSRLILLEALSSL